MFTGLVEGKGTIANIQPEGSAIRLTVQVPAAMAGESTIGDSIAINGCCLTVVEITDDTVAFEAGSETLSKTNLGELHPGHIVNLERSLPVNGRLGGHFVQGHVDGVGRIQGVCRTGSRP